ncbi:MAG: hypothetical protein GY946_07425 [bacterium]|nr:hypothetical protein [bacterium]
MSRKLVLSFLWLLLGSLPSGAATITGTWVAEIDTITMSPDFPLDAAPSVQVGDQFTYRYQVTTGDTDPSDPRFGTYRISPAIGLLTAFGETPFEPSLRVTAPGLLTQVYGLLIGQVVSAIDATSVAPNPPAGLNFFQAFVDFSLKDFNVTDTPNDGIPLGALDLTRFNEPGNTNYFDIEFDFVSGPPQHQSSFWIAEGRVVSVTHVVPEPAVGWMLCTVLGMLCASSSNARFLLINRYF